MRFNVRFDMLSLIVVGKSDSNLTNRLYMKNEVFIYGCSLWSAIIYVVNFKFDK